MTAPMNAKPPTSSATPAAAAPAPAAPTLPVAGDPGQLIDSDRSPVAGPGQLVSFGRFVSKDPFVPQVGKRCADSTGVAITCPTASPRAPASKPKRPIKEPVVEVAVPVTKPSKTSSEQASARVSVNGATDGVTVGATFPASDPVFRLVSASGTTAKVGVDGGSYASGDSTIALTKGRPVTLVNTADGMRYRLVLVATG